jgi:hypothetical protein
MRKSEGVGVFCEGARYIINSEDELRERLRGMQKTEEVKLGKKVLPVEITNGRKALEIFVAASSISGWEKNGKTPQGAYYIRGIHEIAEFFRPGLA